MRISDWSSDVCSSDLRGLDGRYARAPEHARGIVLVEQNRADRIMAYGADAMGEEQPAFVEFDGRAAIADLDELPRIFGLHDHLAEAPFVEVVRQDEVQALIVVADRKSTRLNSSH